MARSASSSEEAEDIDTTVNSESQANKEGYVVGYGKPPIHSRFRKGQSGNPRGRTAGSKNEKTLVREILGKKIPVRTPEGQRRLNSFEISLIKLREKAAQGDIRAIREVLGYLAQISAASEQEAASGKTPAVLAPGDEQILEYLLGHAPGPDSNKAEPGDD